jgi:hypothetical protein
METAIRGEVEVAGEIVDVGEIVGEVEGPHPV